MKNTHQINTLSYELAQSLVIKAQSIAAEQALAVCVAVVDSTGRLKAYVAMDGASPIAEEMAIKKAKTALLGLTSAQLGEVMQAAPAAMLSMGVSNNISYLGGGVPIMLDEQLIGAIAVGGATPEQDEACAQAALNAVL